MTKSRDGATDHLRQTKGCGHSLGVVEACCINLANIRLVASALANKISSPKTYSLTKSESSFIEFLL